MGLRDTLRTLLGLPAVGDGPPDGLRVFVDSEGVNFVLPAEDWSRLLQGSGSPERKLQLVVLRMLEEQGLADSLPNGFRVAEEDIAGMESEQAEILGLPAPYPYAFTARISGRTGHSSFAVDLSADTPDGPAPLTRKGPCLYLGSSEVYRLAPAELVGLHAVERHAALSPEQRGEGANLRLMAELQTAARSGMRVDLSHFERLEVVVPEGIGVVGASMPDGSLLLSPTLGDGSRSDELRRRWSQIDLDADGGVLRIDHRVVLLDEERMRGVREVFSNRRIPADQVPEFLKTPTAFLDAALVDLDVGFSVRVEGVGALIHMSFGELDGDRADWFGAGAQPVPPQILRSLIRSAEDLDAFETALREAWGQGADSIRYSGELIDVSDRGAVESLLEDIRATLLRGEADEGLEPPESGEEPEPDEAGPVSVLLRDADEIRADLLAQASQARPRCEIAWDRCTRSPYPHQVQGVSWLLGLIDAADRADAEDLYRLQGGLLADDMGLGKTYMGLVAVGEFLEWQRTAGNTCKPTLVVAPLSLIENWEAEVAATFVESLFRDVVALQSGRDLGTYRVSGTQRESVQLQAMDDDDEPPANGIRYALKIGPEAGAGRLDMDGRLVLTTYQTLRDYQFSLCSVDWGVVIFDEAQNIKNPNTLQTRAAKGLKADFKLLATGTPVENSLADFWCLLDTAQPGLLGDWRAFRERWITPILEADEASRDEVRRDVGQRLREAVGVFMLRRIKEDQLKGLPIKTIRSGVSGGDHDPVVHDPKLGAMMQGGQRKAYDDAIADYRLRSAAEDMRGQALAALQYLREITLHPDLRNEHRLLVDGEAAARGIMRESAKLTVLLDVLDQVRDAGEKVIIFLVSKRLQRLLKLWLDEIYDLDVAIINGDTAAVASSRDVQTRRQLIEKFESAEGFNVLIMSPIAAGVGLTVVGANHAVHLERHWNPAKEAQASDRIYRIGQTRDVTVYLPASLHPTLDSFDVHLDRLLRGKLMLKDAVVTPESVRDDELLSSLGI